MTEIRDGKNTKTAAGRGVRKKGHRRRLIAVFVATLVLSILTAGVAQNDDGDAPESFGVPLPHVGDKGTYTATVVDVDGDSVQVIEEERVLLHFEWLTPRSIHDHEGLERRVNELHIWPYELEEDENKRRADGVNSFDVTSGELVVSSHVQTGSSPAPGEEYRRTFLHTEPDQFVILCGLQNHLQGNEMKLSSDITLFRPCSYEDHWSPHGDFKARGAERLGEHNTVFFAQGDGSFEHRPKKFAWFSQEYPYPLRLTVERQDDPGTYIVMRLTEFERGDAPIETESRIESGPPLAPLELRPAGAHGPETDGFFADFPISEALERAKEHSDATELRDYLADHPNATVVEASRSNTYGPGERDETEWRLTLSNGDGFVAFIINRERDVAEETIDVLGTPVPTGSDEPTTTYRYQEHGPMRGPYYPAPEMLPDMPTAASLAEWWQRHAADRFAEAEPDSLSFTIECKSETCSRTWHTMAIGVSHATRTQQDDGGTAHEETQSTFEMDTWFGEPRYEMTKVQRTYGFNSGGLTETEPGPSEFNPSALRVAIWTFPDGYLLAGAGVMAILTTIAYVAWTTLKTGGVIGLFSRISGPKLLDHPLRSRIYDTIEANPGIHIQELANRTGYARQTAEHHLRRLTGSGLVQLTTHNGYTCFYAKGRLDRRVVKALPYLKASGARKVIDAITRRPDISAAEVATVSGMAPSTVNYHLKRLRDVGLVEATRDGAVLQLRISPFGTTMLREGHVMAAT